MITQQLDALANLRKCSMLLWILSMVSQFVTGHICSSITLHLWMIEEQVVQEEREYEQKLV